MNRLYYIYLGEIPLDSTAERKTNDMLGKIITVLTDSWLKGCDPTSSLSSQYHEKMNTGRKSLSRVFRSPHYLLSQKAAPIGLLFQPLPQGMGAVAVHINLTEHVKLSVVRLCKLLDLSLSAWLLQNKTHWETQQSALYKHEASEQ